MKFETIKRVILAAILLPFVFMLIEGVVVIRSSIKQYRDLEKDRQFADVLARGGSIAATEILSEIAATRLYLAYPGSTTAAEMQRSRVTLDRERRAFYASLPSRDTLDDGLVGELSVLSLAYSRIIAARSAVDQGRYAGSDPGSIYWYAALKQLAVVDALSPLISDPMLLEKSNQLMGILLTYYGERLITGVGTRYLDRGVSARFPVEQFVQGKTMLGEGMDHMVFHSAAPIVREIVAYLGRSSQVKANAITDAILAGSRPTRAVRDVWAAAQSERMTFLQQKMVEAAKDIHETGESLSRRAHIHLTRILALCAGLLILATLVMVLAARGLRLIDRLTRDRETLVGELRNAAQTDLLTGLYNRRGFEVAASALLTQAEHGSRWISVVLFDLDHFKRTNDVHGHDAGDAVLRQVAGVARENFRSFDLLVRHGGEEFLALLPDSTPDDAVIVAERVRLAIEAAEIPLPSGEILKVTASFGCAGRANEVSNRNFEDLVKRADLALYAAKASGRNCVVSGPIVQASAPEERRKTASGGGFDSRK
ncbi:MULTISPECIES: GGDEF domain-containing protein [Rhizobium]|jgi:diguanylate cyclase (GGDEF)-like protein|uniref:diguanylate cyclase n=1 Tax=Rhizobium anhuiense TaxID=1184720 RepID=A0ABX4J318_9HYPH|nr:MULTISPECIES: GGDEF domain-containing protein [Rhizobium]KZS55756.1 diguanylate cyclase [Rhizobium anhuiense bv. trifolii]MBB3302099.1 diguanylate cyclase (GGDEF)-like protein [Rhizobium sp. BK112]MBB3371255.1 diguanylate cyclase (GGDEF)-like protein [Rhizobium sp. BK077]MBB3745360.1 diguanylate cyclase (GGDEF)-like protein [Rhizobium sp. BK591]MBB4117108.1 diguanylate cyclase (GGDEF)-like protein [Rhizobium sp. BK226]